MASFDLLHLFFYDVLDEYIINEEVRRCLIDCLKHLLNLRHLLQHELFGFFSGNVIDQIHYKILGSLDSCGLHHLLCHPPQLFLFLSDYGCQLDTVLIRLETPDADGYFLLSHKLSV